MARQKNKGARIRNREQLDKALELRKAGATFQQVGDALGVTKQRAFQLVEVGIAELNEKCTASADSLRRQQEERLDAMRLALWKGRNNPRTADTLLRIEERLAKLRGLDAPTKTALTDPDGNEVPAQVMIVFRDAEPPSSGS